ncbi:MAG: hypothetical protein Kow00133_21150 [Amphiplicatus sp.]
MPKPRTPTKILELKGAFRKDPQRRRVDPKVEPGLGPPPDYFEAHEREIWREIEASAPEGVLARSDRLCVEMLVGLVAKLRAREPMKAAERAFMLSTLTRLGCTPADRSRVAEPKREEETGDLFDFLAATTANGAA